MVTKLKNIQDKFSLEGKTAVVTGGSRLLGAAIVRAFLESGAAVWVTSSRRQNRAEELFPEFAGRVFDGYFDMTAADAREQLIALRERILHRFGKVDILVNNATVRAPAGSPDSVLRDCIADNEMAVLYATEVFAEAMCSKGSGSIINIGSNLGNHGPDAEIYKGTKIQGYLPDYSLQKGAVANFTRFTASRYGPYGVRCNCISPAGVETENTPADFAENYRKRIPMGRMASAEDVAGIGVFLASEASAFITGADVPLDGGYSVY